MFGRTPVRVAKLGAATLVASVALAIAASSAFATPETIYNNYPVPPPPGNVVSQAFEATQLSQFGGAVEFAGTARTGGSVSVGLSSWACESGTWQGTPECITAPGARFEVPMTLRVYEEEPSGEPGKLVIAVSKVQKVAYRPSESRLKCVNGKGEPEGGWYQKGNCYHGKLTKVLFNLGGKVVLPAKAIISVQFNTSDYGPVPQRPQPCNSTPQGCPYDSLNVGLAETGPSVGTDPQPNDAYQDTVTPSNFCDGGAGGTGVFRLDAGCWAPYQPMFLVKSNQ